MRGCEGMYMTFTEEEVKGALLYHIYAKTGECILPEEADIHFIKDGNSTRIDEINIYKK
jgi:hypothetical protein